MSVSPLGTTVPQPPFLDFIDPAPLTKSVECIAAARKKLQQQVSAIEEYLKSLVAEFDTHNQQRQQLLARVSACESFLLLFGDEHVKRFERDRKEGVRYDDQTNRVYDGVGVPDRL